ncbi:MAG: alpha/beta fold hydrolase [Deltaproteobacteria bacterium]|nr:alpha/beta fold hydrolase [Deltaproteobacteria bacterium]
METVPVHFFSCGSKCAALVWRPDAGGSERPRPGVVMCHGFTGIKEWLLPPFAEAFCAAGFVVLTFDYRGFGQSEGARGRLVPLEQVEDIRNAVTFLGAQPGVDAERIGLWGTSFGCANVVQAAGIDPRPWCVVGQVGFGSIPRRMRLSSTPEQRELLRVMLAQDAVQRVSTGVSQLIDPGTILNDEQSVAAFAQGLAALPQLATQLPLEAVERIMEYEPEQVVHRVAPRPLLLIGARYDTAVPISELECLYRAAAELKCLEILDIGHYEIYDLPHRTTAINLALDWFRRFLTPRP